MADYNEYNEGAWKNRGTVSYPRPTTIVKKNTIKDYAKSPDPVKAIKLEDVKDLEEAAKWCGGEVSEYQFHDGLDKVLLYPTIHGGGKARIGHYLVKNRDTGRFQVMNAEEFEIDYHEVGKRQDGISYRDHPAARTGFIGIDHTSDALDMD